MHLHRTSGSIANARATVAGALAAVLVLITGCGAGTAYVRGVSPLNVNDNNESAPVHLRFYQLAHDDQFLRATFESLWLDDAKALGGDLVAKPVVTTVFPGSAGDAPMKVPLGKLKAKTAFIGVMALYRKADAREPRVLVIPAERIDRRIILLSGYGLALDGEESAPVEPQPEKPASPARNTTPAGKAGK